MIKFKNILKEEISSITPEIIERTWKKIFPNSMIIISKGAFGGGLYCSGKLAGSKSEVYNGILENDILMYRFNINNGNYEETSFSILTKPEPGSYYAYGRVQGRKKSIKNIDEKQLYNRFLQLKQLIQSAVDKLPNIPYDINTKI